MPVNLTRVRNDLLEEASEDWIGLHEIVADYQEPGENIPESRRIEVARALVHEMIAQHDGRIFQTREWPPEAWHELPRERWESILQLDSAWKVPRDHEPADLYWIALGP